LEQLAIAKAEQKNEIMKTRTGNSTIPRKISGEIDT
jgi:hypothetical protein